MRFCRCERMVAVADGENEIFRFPVLFYKPFFFEQSGKSLFQTEAFGNEPARNLSAAHIKRELVKLFKVVATVKKSLRDFPLFVIEQYHYMREFDFRVFANRKSRRDTLLYRPFGRPYECGRFFRVFVFFKVDRADYADTPFYEGRFPHGENETFRKSLKKTLFKVFSHIFVYSVYPLLLSLSEVYFGKNKI